jgi:hypothetical protein
MHRGCSAAARSPTNAIPSFEAPGVVNVIHRILLGIDAIVAAVAVYFFVVGLMDGSVSSFNRGLWAVILIGLAAVLWGGHALHSAGKAWPSRIVLAIVAIPGVVAGLFMLLVVVTNPRWN